MEHLESRIAFSAGTGVAATYFDNPDLTGDVVARVDPSINLSLDLGSPITGIAPLTYSVRWRAQVQPRYSETYTFHSTANEGARLWVNGRQLVDDWRDHPTTEKSGRITLAAGEKYDLKMEYYQNTGTAVAKLEWESASQPREVIPTSQLYPVFSEAPVELGGELPRMMRGSAKAGEVLGIADDDAGKWFGRSVKGSDTLTMYTYGGDADLDGRVSTNDYFRIDNGYVNRRSGWSNGDFDHDGAVTTNDFFLIDLNFHVARRVGALTPDQGPPLSLDGQWKMIFRDDFSGTAVNPVWHTTQYWRHDYTVVGGGELQAYDASGASVSNGLLHLSARPDGQYGVPYVSGLVQTGGDDTVSGEPRFSFLHGYMEVRAKLPSGKGLWPAIWMMPASFNDDNGELDVMEFLGSDRTRLNFALHRNGLDDAHEWVGPDFTQGFHTFGVDWQEDHVTWYVDGIERARTSDPALICPEAMYPILNVAIGGWDGPPDAATAFPATMDVDYVRVWQKG
jgi:hypothetical protein